MNQRVLTFCLALSGAAALIYEVIWLRQISLVMGHTAYALSALLTAFLGGLALGAYVGGRWVQRFGASAKLYASLEVIVAVTALLVPLAIRLFDPLFGIAYRGLGPFPVAHGLVQFILCSLVLIIPTAVMGMTLPVVVAATTADGQRIERSVANLYAVNAFGGVVGAAMAGMVLFPALGAFGTLAFAASLNIVAATMAILFARRSAPNDDAIVTQTAPASKSKWSVVGYPLLVVLYGLAGFTALTLQVSWARLVTLSVGSTLYGFTITLVTFIFGIAAGSFGLTRVRWLHERPVRALFVLHAVIAIWTLVSLPWLGTLPARVGEIMGGEAGFGAVWLMELATVSTTIMVPTLAMGAIFPLVAELIRQTVASSGRAVGVAYAANTLGSIVGSMVAGFVLVPRLGMHGTIVLSGCLSAVVAIAYLVPSGLGRMPVALGAGLMATIAALAFWVPAWDPDSVTSAPYLRRFQVGAKPGPAGESIDYVSGPTTVANVRRLPNGTNLLYAGGVLESVANSRPHKYLAHQGLLLHASAQNVLIVGLGAGNTLEAALDYPVARVDCVEISPEIVELTQRHFMRDAFDDPRAHIIVADGRTHLRHSGRAYDVIISQPSYPWAAGAASLFTREYFEELRAGLAPGGVAVIWLPADAKAAASSVLAAWKSVFDNAYLFLPQHGDRIHFVVGFREAEPLDPRFIDYALGTAKVDAAAHAVGIPDAAALMARVLPWPERSDTDGAPPPNSDDNGFVELLTFRVLIEQRHVAP